MNVSNSAHSGEVLYELNSQRERAELTDVVLEVGGRSFPCHRAVLASCSPYFRGMFTSGYVEARQENISIQDVSPVAMATILDYAYTGRLQMEPDQVQAVMSAAKLLQVDFVCKEAVEYMKNHLDVSNCADVLMYADMLGDLDLVEYSGRYIASGFNKVALEPSFQQLPLALLQSLLTRDDLLTNSEDDVVQAALRWLEFYQEECLRHLPSLCLSFRRSFLSSNQLVDLEKKCPSTDIKLVYSDSTTRRLGQARTEMQIFLRDDSTKSAPCYDPSTGELYTMNMPDDIVGFSMAVTPGDELYVAGGVVNCQKIPHDFKGCKKLKTFYEYNHLLNTWEQRCEMISPRVRCGLVHLKGYIYAIVGDDAKETAERYDPSRDEWTSIPPLPHAISRPGHVCSVALGDNIYVIGESEEGYLSFSTRDNTWNKIANRIVPTLHPQAVAYHGSIFCMGNFGPMIGAAVEIYSPVEGEWRRSGEPSFRCHASILATYGETLYLLEVHRNQGEDGWFPHIRIHKYWPERDFWLCTFVFKNSLAVPPMVHWLCSMGLPAELQVHCLTARMVPECLGRDDSGVYKDPPDHGEEFSDDSDGEEDLLDQEDDGSGSDNSNI